MKTRISILALFLLISTALSAQIPVPRFSKYKVAETGCKVYLPADPGEFEASKSEDGSIVYTGEVEESGYHFAVIVVTLSESIGDDNDMKNGLITSYLDFLQVQFAITESAGYGMGHTLDSAPKAVGVIDYWFDMEGTSYALKSWCDGNILSVLMLYGPDEYPIFNAQQMFLDGFRFPEK